VCAADPFCCNNSWDSICVGKVAQYCNNACSAQSSGGGNSCAHSECSEGNKLTATCSQCATDVCAQDSYCCSTEWDDICVDIAATKGSCSC
jgi:hypothetical protein